jgi:mannose-6-phosphate isomerase-like protein (cupin superfamily)
MEENPVMEHAPGRRDMFAALMAFAGLAAAAGAARAEGTAQAPTPPMNTTAELSRSRVIKYSTLKPIALPNGGTQRRVMSGTLPTGEYIEVHESVLPPGKMPHPPHRHHNSERLFIQSGTLEYLDNGKPVPAGAGDIVFSASNITHGLRNVGTTPAAYIVFSVSRQDVPL